MRRAAHMSMWWGPVVMVGALLSGACGDDGIAMTEGVTESGTSSGTTDEPPTTTNTTPPTTTDPTTETTDTPTTTPTSDPSTTSPVTSSTTDATTGTDTDTTGQTTGNTTGDTTDGTTGTTGGTTTGDTDTGSGVMGHSVSQVVNGGTVASSPNFRMVFTIGQPTQNQGTYTSDNFRLQGGLIGANGNPP